MDFALLAFLIVLNGAFAMSEMALTASRRARLQVMVEDGQPGAQAAMTLHENPTKWLSTVQIGITSIGVLNGIIGEAAFSAPLAEFLQRVLPLTHRVATISATIGVVASITFLTIIFGELVPKRLGQMYPEAVARLVSRPMNMLSSAARPFVMLLGASTEAVLHLLGIRGGTQRSVTEEEIAASIEEGLDAGIIEAQEHRMVRNVFRLDDRNIGSMMIPRADIVWLDATAPIEDTLKRMLDSGHSRYPVCRGGLDEVIGVLATHTLLPPLAQGATPNLADHLLPPLFVPETVSGMELLAHFRLSSADMVFVVDEYGAVQGVVSERDLLEAIIGEIGTPAGEDAWAVQRPDGSWLMDGLIPVPELKDRLELKEVPEEDRGRYNTLSGMVLLLLGRLAEPDDAVDWAGWRFVVMALDGKRIDKLLVSRIEEFETSEL
jgi:putative hemolysin